MNVAVVTDSTADLPAGRAEQLGIAVVPLIVTIDGAAYEDGLELPPLAYYEKLAGARDLPTTSQPSIEAFRRAYERLDASEVVSIHISGKLSGTVNSARAAAAQVPGKSIRVIDSQGVSMAMGYLAQLAAEMASGGASIDDIQRAIEERVPSCGFYAVLDTLQHARRSGRISFAQALVGSVLQVKPILTLRDGAVAPDDRPRTMRKGLDRLAELTLKDGPFEFLAVPHANNEPLARELAERLAPSFGGQIDVVTTGAVIGTHCGPGAVATCYVRKAPAP